MKKFAKYFVILIIITVFPQFTNAAVTTYTDRSAWLSAVGPNVTVVDFNNITGPDILIDPQNGGAPYDVGPFTISEIGSQATDTRIDPPPSYGGFSVNGTTDLQGYFQAAGNTRVTRLSYDSPILAWGVDTRRESYYSGLLGYFTFDGVGWFNPPIETSVGFFGIVSTDSFSTVTITSSYAARFALDDVSSAVPIPGAVWLLGSGLLGLIGIRRRLKK